MYTASLRNIYTFFFYSSSALLFFFYWLNIRFGMYLVLCVLSKRSCLQQNIYKKALKICIIETYVMKFCCNLKNYSQWKRRNIIINVSVICKYGNIIFFLLLQIYLFIY